MEINSEDINKAISLWEGEGRPGSDRGNVEGLSWRYGWTNDRLYALVRAAKDRRRQPTGGYSVIRRFRGGLRTWIQDLEAFRKDELTQCMGEWRETNMPQPLWRAVAILGNMARLSKAENLGPLGVSAASKILFFACPEAPLFIFDSVVKEAYDFAMRGKQGWPRRIDTASYADWWRFCSEFQGQTIIDSATSQITGSGLVSRDWVVRRCVDNMLYRCGKAIQAQRRKN